MKEPFKSALRRIRESGQDLLPILVVVGGFQLLLPSREIPDLGGLLEGAVLVLLGLAMFISGLEMGLFPLGENLAQAFARKGSVFWMLVFGFGLGFTTTYAEPSLIAVAGEAAAAVSETGLLPAGGEEEAAFVQGLRLTVALSVGTAIALGVMRIITGWAFHKVIIIGYIIAGSIAPFAPDEIIGIAFDAGGVTTSTVTVPLVTALGVGLATAIAGRRPMIDGFGLIAFASLLPMIFVMGFGILTFGPQ